MFRNYELHHLAQISPYSIKDIEPIYLDCIHIYWEEGFKKCLNVVLTAQELDLSLYESFELQKMIDLYLL